MSHETLKDVVRLMCLLWSSECETYRTSQSFSYANMQDTFPGERSSIPNYLITERQPYLHLLEERFYRTVCDLANF